MREHTGELSCCMRCHVAWEEQHIFPFLPTTIRASLLQEHAELRKNGFPRGPTIEHGLREVGWFRRYVPRSWQYLVAQAEDEHRKLEPGL